MAAASAPVQDSNVPKQRSRRGPACEAQRRGAVVAVGIWRRRGGGGPTRRRRQRGGIAATAAVPLRWGGQSLGCLDLHSATPRPWMPGDLSAAAVLVRVVAGPLATDATLRKRQQSTEQLENALESRVVIEQPKGIVAAEGNLTVDETFDRLRRHARRHRTSVHDVAQAVIDGHLHLTRAPSHRVPD
ncbi:MULTISPECIES: ANTAR domain-containing protein [unclassified Rhodococcus (in: high G+C Gram-positive bacteria)]|uniref:ANTAR domain-containing protein n=1 Tax=unclassified Rhodococcus (in: high G+C Gram-positive bacteria) TaxID=192944 RepID=UPI000306CC58|nr:MULTISPECIES: ANTAR domain-containing protein [unclassified Rhodococcus (in: high G+C Gram-positive bacteria)]MBC2637417.1 ANTAR domain-containing protein [Rhodococcus sp. 3A]MBC2898148.1 ANTAR domain-containing protein [Rhodococcus sp. 4CII]